MSESTAARPMVRTDAERWRDAIAAANVPTLLAAVVHLTGEEGRWLTERYRPARSRGLGDDPTGGLPADVQAEIRDAAEAAFAPWRDGLTAGVPDPDPSFVVRVLRFVLGDDLPDDYGPMAVDDLRRAIEAGRVPEAGTRRGLHSAAASDTGPGSGAATDADPAADHVVGALVIGAGMSGIAASVELARAGIDHLVLERHDDVGGTWLENRYPGCGVDVPSHLYSYSYAPYDWSSYFSLRDEIQGYFVHMATELGVRRRTRFRTEVERAVWDDETACWVVHVRGEAQPIRSRLLFSAVGAFGTPRIPDVPGAGTFAGPEVHTARWPAGLDLTGKRVVVIGSGASAMQVVPEIAPRVAELTIFQRSPHWAAPFDLFHVPIPEPVRFLLREMPVYRAWYRLRLGWAFNDKAHAGLQKDPAWPHPERSLNAINDAHRRMMTDYIRAELGDRTDLLDAVLPTYPPFGKRMLLDNGWYRTLRRDNVTLRAEAVAEIRPDGVVGSSGTLVEADVIVWATGFDVARFLAPIDVVGRSGRSIHDVWDGDDPRAYLGTMVPDFPNFFCLYGPNTQFGHGGSLIPVIETQLHYVMQIIGLLRTSGADAIEVRPEVHDAYNEAVQAAHRNMVWTHPGMDTYYRNRKGRVVVNNPFRIVDTWHRTRTASPEEFLLHRRRAR